MRSSDETIKTDDDVPCHSKCGTIKKPPYSKFVSTGEGLKFSVTSFHRQ